MNDEPYKDSHRVKITLHNDGPPIDHTWGTFAINNFKPGGDLSCVTIQSTRWTNRFFDAYLDSNNDNYLLGTLGPPNESQTWGNFEIMFPCKLVDAYEVATPVIVTNENDPDQIGDSYSYTTCISR